MSSALSYLAAAIAILSSGYKLISAGGVRAAPGARYLCAMLALLGVSTAVMAPASLIAASRIEPVPNFTRLLGNGFGMAAAFCLLGLLAHTVGTGSRVRLRWQGVGLVAALSAMMVLLIVADTRFTVNFVDSYARDPLVAGYLLVFLCYIAWSIVSFKRQTVRYVRQLDRGWLRAGLDVVVAGIYLGLVWVSWAGTIVLIKLLGGVPVPIEKMVSTMIAASSVALVAIGGSLTAWGPYVLRPFEWLRHYRAYRSIGPLWTELCAAVPEIELSARGEKLRGTAFALYRRIIEIRDGHLALRLYFHPEVAGWASTAARAAGITEPRRIAAIIEAASFAAAITAKRAGHRYRDDPDSADAPSGIEPDVEAESRWLVAVSRAFTDSPIVHEICGRVRAELGSGAPVSGD
ncbi:MAG: hypothetical protein GEU98_26575 [Pseudonocardiaceae bacterium]|nr:hypothetical protein [Pseudonocardiaceae bacterium]